MSLPQQNTSPLARQARELFVVRVGRALPELVQSVQSRLTELRDQMCSPLEATLRREAWMGFQRAQGVWIDHTRTALQEACRDQATQGGGPASQPGKLELVDDAAVNDQILASRLAMRVLDKASQDINALRLRIQHLERRQEMSRSDILLPEVVCRILLEQWVASGMTREAWSRVVDAMVDQIVLTMQQAYQATNEFLIASGVMKEIDLQSLVRRAPSARVEARAPAGEDTTGSRSSSMGVADETRMLTGTSPLARARMRAQGVMGRLKRLLIDHVGGDFEATQVLPPSPQLQRAMARSEASPSMGIGLYRSGASASVDAVDIERTASALRQRAAELKQAASTPTEKATVEVVALMFQSILAEERIPASVRVWFARLQIPVLRVALAEPEFFSALQHPARKLIDRMGSCVMGFESDVTSAALEAEIKRIVQVIEQYPETGRRVFQLVFDEFDKFLSAHLRGRGTTPKVVSVAQQVEQKETLSVQYTIELRKLLDDVPVRDEIRTFLFKVWVDVLALASVKHGLKSEETQALKQAASDLLWAAGAKPSRNDRARVIQQLPGILQRLRQGMSLLGYPQGLQDQHIKAISDTLADAFMSRTEPIAQDQLDRLSQRLANLEDYLPQDGVGDLDLDAESIEMITGVDASNIEVINVGGSQPSEAMRQWARELQIGSWFGLDHGARLVNVQLAWRSDRGQLSMFVTATGRCYLIQAQRLAAFLQAGLLVPTEEESLTVRATREALDRLDANPGRLLA